jgi:hypothetical protein
VKLKSSWTKNALSAEVTPLAVPILDIRIRAIPFEDVAAIVAYGFNTEQEPAILSIEPAQAWLLPNATLKASLNIATSFNSAG